MNLAPTTGRILREARIKNNLSLSDVAKKLQVSIQMICDVEAGRKALPTKYVDDWSTAVGEDPDFIAVNIWQQKLEEFNRNRKSSKKIVFKVVPVIQENHA